MKKVTIYSFFLLSFSLVFWGCVKDDTYPGGEISPYIALFDVRNIHRGQDVTLTQENMLGSSKIAVMVVSDHSGGNMPAGLLVVQDYRRLGELRGISIPLGDDAATYVPGDSLIIKVEGKMLKRVDGLLQLTGVSKSDITKVSSGNEVYAPRVPSSFVFANPGKYESTLGIIVKGSFDPLPTPTDVLAGTKTLNDGFANIPLITDPKATFAGNSLAIMGNYYGIFFSKTTPKADSLAPVIRLRKGDDVVLLSSVIEIPPVIITGFISDVSGGDGNYEYVQMMATKDINFAATPFSMVVTNNANAAVPTGYPASGWATGQARTYKFNITSGSAAKGTFFYVGGTNKMINGPNSTSMATSNWVKTLNYTTTNGDGFGNKTGGLFANLGNASGLAVFEGTNVTVDSKPVDVLFVDKGGSLFTLTPQPMGYKIANTDWYDVKNPITLQNQPYYRQGSNTLCMGYTIENLGFFYVMGGEYNLGLGKWTKARAQKNVLLAKDSPVSMIEGEGATILK